MQVSEIYLSCADNTLVSNIVLIHFKPTFSTATPLENIKVPQCQALSFLILIFAICFMIILTVISQAMQMTMHPVINKLEACTNNLFLVVS